VTPLQPAGPDAVLAAMAAFDREGWPEGFSQKNVTWFVLHPETGQPYPCKAIWGLATGRPGKDFTSGEPIRTVLDRLGFETVRLGAADHPPVPDPTAPPLLEGKEGQITRNARERNPIARRECIDHYRQLCGGRLACRVCDLDFGERYGDLGEGFIHVHHLTPLAGADGPRIVDPRDDLVPVCPNCHAMLHRGRHRDEPRSIEELRGLVEHRKKSG